jgi:hypothetical protein
MKEDRRFSYKRNILARSRNHCCCGKALSITYSKCVSVALIIQHAMRMRRIILALLACPAVPYFPTYLLNCTIFAKKVTEYKICFDFLYNFETFLIVGRNQRDIIINVHRYPCKGKGKAIPLQAWTSP